MTVRVAHQRSTRRYASAALLVAFVPCLADCSSDTAETPAGGCLSFAHVATTGSTELSVSPTTVHAGGTITVKQPDRGQMDFSSFTLYGDTEAGCRIYSLFLRGSGKSGWRDVTDETQGSIASLVISARQQTYVMPGDVEPGGYLLCSDEMPPKVTCGGLHVAG